MTARYALRALGAHQSIIAVAPTLDDDAAEVELRTRRLYATCRCFARTRCAATPEPQKLRVSVTESFGKQAWHD